MDAYPMRKARNKNQKEKSELFQSGGGKPLAAEGGKGKGKGKKAKAKAKSKAPGNFSGGGGGGGGGGQSRGKTPDPARVAKACYFHQLGNARMERTVSLIIASCFLKPSLPP